MLSAATVAETLPMLLHPPHTGEIYAHRLCNPYDVNDTQSRKIDDDTGSDVVGGWLMMSMMLLRIR